MLNDDAPPSSPDELAKTAVDTSGDEPTGDAATPPFDESLAEELAALIDDGKTYAEAELAFQKTRASLAGKNIGLALGFAVLAVVLMHIAFLALAVGLVIALQPIASIWGAIAIVVGALLLLTGLLTYSAIRRGKIVAAMFANGNTSGDKG